MKEFIKLDNLEQFENLKKGDVILISWNSKSEVWDKGMMGDMIYTISENRESCDEIILRYRGNHYFNYKMFLNGESKIVKEAYLIKDAILGADE